MHFFSVFPSDPPMKAENFIPLRSDPNDEKKLKALTVFI